MAAGAFTALVRTRQGQLSRLHRVPLAASISGSRGPTTAGRRNRAALHPRRGSEGARPLPAAYEFRRRNVHCRHHPVRQGVALSVLISQAVYRGDVVIILDPKNSKRLKRAVVGACEDTRDPDTFLEFHPAFPERGVRLDPTFNWQKPTELASRIQSIMPPDTAGAFSAFGWDAVNVVVQGLVELEDRPNLMKLARYIEGGIEPVLVLSLRRFFDAMLASDWRELPEIKKP